MAPEGSSSSLPTAHSDKQVGDRDIAAELIRGGISSLSLSARSKIGDHHQQSSEQVDEEMWISLAAERFKEKISSVQINPRLQLDEEEHHWESGELHQRWDKVPPTSANVNETNSERLEDPVKQAPLTSLRGKTDIEEEMKTSSQTAR